VPPDEGYAVSAWLKGLLADGIQQFVLDSLEIRKASPPGQITGFKPDGSNVPWVIARLKETDPERFAEWIWHLQTALPDLTDIRTIEREDDKHRSRLVHAKTRRREVLMLVHDAFAPFLERSLSEVDQQAQRHLEQARIPRIRRRNNRRNRIVRGACCCCRTARVGLSHRFFISVSVPARNP